LRKYFTIETSLLIEQLTSFFRKKKVITTNDLELFYNNKEGNIKRNTLNWRIFNMVNNGILTRTSKGQFRIGANVDIESELPDLVIKIHNLIKKKFPYLRYCIWDTNLVRSLSLHVPSQLITIVDVEIDGVEAVFHCLQEKFKNVFLLPDQTMIDKYVAASKVPIIVKVLISEAPVIKIQGKLTPSIEKILVDILFEKEFLMYQGSEMAFIFRNAFESYPIKISKMMRYATRKRKKEELMNFLSTNKLIAK